MSKLELKKAAELLRALGHSERLKIMALLAQKKGRKMSVSEIQKEVGLDQPETSRHLTLMKNALLLGNEKIGPSSYYFINPEVDLSSFIARLIHQSVNF